MEKATRVTEQTAEKILNWQKRCIVCGGTYSLHIHHRIFKSEGERGLISFLETALDVYKKCYRISLRPWSLNEIQNLVVLCASCHEGKGIGVHGGNNKLRHKLRNTFTDPNTGFSIPFYKEKRL